MSDRILRALMQLFALVAKIDEVSESDNKNLITSSKGQHVIKSFLKTQLASSDVNKYLKIFNERLNATRALKKTGDQSRKHSARQSVKALKICAQVNKELTQRQKIIVIIRMLEFVQQDGSLSQRELDFVQTIADSFNISSSEYNEIKEFVAHEPKSQSSCVNMLSYIPQGAEVNCDRSIELKALDAPILFLYVKSIGSLFVHYLGNDELFINSTVVAGNRIHLISSGSSIRTSKTKLIYHGNVLNFILKEESDVSISYELKNVIHKFNNGKFAVRKINIASNGGNLIGIMGASGTGKSSLLNIMNGRVKPTFGDININGIDLFNDHRKLQGFIGNIGQDDLLNEDLTVFENLYLSAKLSLGGLTNSQITKRVIQLLKQLGLYEIRYLRVGNELNKIISGGQRKRLNIAIELIREPSILFVDEPTSGLSGRDSESIMGLLKEIALTGKLVFVVIHQPSSNTFKMFDRLLMMDEGGFMVYDGLPSNAIVHFKMHSYQGNAHESECGLCGNINTDLIFDLLESEVLDEYGGETGVRKKDPEEWHQLYLENKMNFRFESTDKEPKAKFKLPNSFTQFLAYLYRDVKSKLSNIQYLVTNSLVAPALALLLALFIKYTNSEKGIYTYFDNENIPQFIFMSVIVAVFLGLTLSAEEINKDKTILLRETYLKLSRNSYLLSKIAVLFSITAIQILLYVLVSHAILDIQGLTWTYWVVLFSAGCMANITGLVISSTFNSAKVIYILVPLVIIPQILFSGVIVKFDKLHPVLSDATKVPFIGNAMVSRWAYEALTVEQTANNELETYFFDTKVKTTASAWKKDFWIPEIRKHLDILRTSSAGENDISIKQSKDLLISELQREEQKWKGLACKSCIDNLNEFRSGYTDAKLLDPIENFLSIIKLQSIRDLNEGNKKIEKVIDSLGIDKFRELRNKFTNESLNDLTTNSLEENKLIISGTHIFRNDDPIYHLPSDQSFFNAHFYAPYKYIGSKRLTTRTANIIIIWTMSVFLYILLYFDVLRRGVDLAQRLSSRILGRK
ncbi:MAG: ATP-binding cassette domain-containing protein [Crocinitomicaceae bacterium]